MNEFVVRTHGCTPRAVGGRTVLEELMSKCSCVECEGEDDKKCLVCD